MTVSNDSLSDPVYVSDVLISEASSNDDDLSDAKAFNRVARDIMIILWSLLILSQLIHLFYSRSNRNLPVIKSLKYISLTFVVGIIIGYVFSILEFRVNKVLRYPYYICMNVVVACLYLFSFLQLYYSFRDSSYCISKRMIRTHVGLLCVAEIFFIVWAVLDFPDEFENRYNIKTRHWWKQMAVVVAGFVLLLIVTHLVYTFNHNLFSVIADRSRMRTHRHLPDPSQTASGSDTTAGIEKDTVPPFHRQSTLNREQTKMLDIMVKHTVLNTMETGLGYLLCFFWILTALIDPDGEQDIGSITRLWLVFMMVVIFTTVMLLSFAKENHKYYPICKKCDAACNRLCEDLAERKIGNNTLKPPPRPHVVEIAVAKPLPMKDVQSHSVPSPTATRTEARQQSLADHSDVES